MLASKCAWRDNGVHFFDISTFKNALRPSVFNTLTSKCASHHSRAHFLKTSTSKSAPVLMGFAHFDFEMCFAPKPRTWVLFKHVAFKMCFVPQRRALFQHLNLQKWSEHVVVLAFDFKMCFAPPQRRALFEHLHCQEWSEPAMFFNMFTSKCASHHNGVHFLSISTSKNAPKLRWFYDFDFETRFAPQWHALFPDLNFQKVPTLRCFVHFDLHMCFAPQQCAMCKF